MLMLAVERNKVVELFFQTELFKAPELRIGT